MPRNFKIPDFLVYRNGKPKYRVDCLTRSKTVTDNRSLFDNKSGLNPEHIYSRLI